MSTPTRAAVEALPRYDLERGIDCDDQICTAQIAPRDEGEYVYRSSVLALFAASPPEQQTPQPNEDTP